MRQLDIVMLTMLAELAEGLAQVGMKLNGFTEEDLERSIQEFMDAGTEDSDGFFVLEEDDLDAEEDEYDLWDNPPPPAASWPNVANAKPKVSLWDNPPPKADSWPNVGAPDAIGDPHTGWPRVETKVPKNMAPAAPPLAQKNAAVLRETVGRDSRRRACCPTSIIKAVGIKPLQFVFVAHRANGNGLVILQKAAKTGHLATYRVDKDGNIRLSPNILTKGGLDRAGSIKFRTSGDHIVVVAG